jgi:hypothetical protein
MMFLLLSFLPMLLTLLASAVAIPMLVAMHVRRAEAPVEADMVGGWEALEEELALAEIDQVWCVLVEVMDEVEEWNALMGYAATCNLATVHTLPMAQSMQCKAA